MSKATSRLSGTNLERAADHNQRVTLHAIRVGGALTRLDLAQITGLTGQAITNITKRLLQDGLIQEAGQRRGGRGQPATRLQIRSDASYSIGVNVDRDHITMVLVDFAGRTLARRSKEVDFALPADVRAFYRRAIKPMVRAAKVDAARLVGLGVAVPDDLGAVDMPGRPAAYDAWERVDMAALFAEPFALPVFVENDAAAAATGELQLGRGQQLSNFFYILISSGLGGGVVNDGVYARGAHGRSGELGFMRVPGDHGVPEQVQKLVSRAGLQAQLARDGFTFAEALAPDAPAAARESCERWLDRAAERLSRPLEAISCLIDPAAVLIAGRLPAAMIDALAARTNALLAQAIDLPAMARLERAALSEDAPAMGAAILPFSHFLLPKPGALWKAID